MATGWILGDARVLYSTTPAADVVVAVVVVVVVVSPIVVVSPDFDENYI